MKKIIFILFWAFLCKQTDAQLSEPKIRISEYQILSFDSSANCIIVFDRCRNKNMLKLEQNMSERNQENRTPKNCSSKAKELNTKLKGFITYEYYKNERMDTPFVGMPFEQHSVNGSITISINNKYPIQLNFNTRIANNLFQKNFFDIGFNFKPESLKKTISKSLMDSLEKHSMFNSKIDSLTFLMRRQINVIQNLKNEINSFDIKNDLIEERKIFLNDLKNFILTDSSGIKPVRLKVQENYEDSLNIKMEAEVNDSLKFMIPTNKRIENYKISNKPVDTHLDTSFISKYRMFDIKKDTFPKMPCEIAYQNKLLKLDSLSKDFSKTNTKLDSFQKLKLQEKITFNDSLIRGLINKNNKNLTENNKLSTLDLFLLKVKSFGLGRNLVSYSDLTINNQNLFGIQAELQGKYYTSIAGGSIDYNYRDVFLTNISRNIQSFYIIRIGTNQNKPTSFIVSAFTGSKNIMQQSSISSNFSGLSFSFLKKIDNSTNLNFEVAKTTSPIFRNSDPSKLKSLFNVNDNSNLAFSVKFDKKVKNGILQLTARKIGDNFQSINFFGNQSSQLQLQARINHSFFNKTLMLDLSIKNYKFITDNNQIQTTTNTITKSISLLYKKRNLPYISVGYYPTSLNFNLSNKVIINNYYVTNILSGYSFYTKKASYNTSLSYQNFNALSSDSNQINNWSIFNLSQNFSNRIITLWFNYSQNRLHDFSFNTYEVKNNIKLSNSIGLSCGLKLFDSRNQDYLFGYNFNTNIKILNFGNIDLFFEKQYLPNTNNHFLGSNMGRLVFTKFF